MKGVTRNHELLYSKLVNATDNVKAIVKLLIGKNRLLIGPKGQKYRDHLDSIIQSLTNLKTDAAVDCPSLFINEEEQEIDINAL